ncbi:MAG: winged helix-turn-helix domain-containing protein [Acidobacteria bacterium]|jgi:DNA-binding winged helix-turn-helix (wHTH) protein/TolB-like protein|nr:winged helix-turn-helix domain-containing protein [Acidobacteriota bacterium]MBA4122296.1 winged helix-turn-helix domain-containing protein [Acidobacteriota bacterium]
MSKENKELYEFDKFHLDVSERFLLRNGKRVALADRAFDTLCVLVRRGNQLVGKDELMTEVWADAIVEENNLDKNISALRRILGERNGKQRFIETVRGHGYRFVAEVRRVDGDAATLKRGNGDAAKSEPPAVAGGFSEVESRESSVENDLESQISNFKSQNTETNRTKSEGQGTKPSSGSRQSGNVVALAAWRHEAAANDAGIAEPAINQIHEGLHMNAVAVLPFKLIAIAVGDEYLGIGMADALIVSLSKIGDLQVRPTASVVPFAMSGANPIGAGRELKVEAILDGKIHQSGDNLRVSLQLIRVADGSLLWAEKFDGTVSGIFRLEDEISVFIAQKLRRNLNENTLRLLTTRGTKLLAAYQAFLKARFHFHQGLPEHYQKSNAFYAEAIRLDPNYAQAYPDSLMFIFWR